MSFTEKIAFREITPRRIVLWGLYWEALMLPFSIAAAQWGIGVAAIGWMGMMFSEKRFRGSLGAITLPTVAYILICTITSAFAERTGHSLGAVWDNEWLLFSAVIMFAAKPDADEFRTILRLFFISSGIAGALGLGEHFTGIRYKAENKNMFEAYHIGNFVTYRPILFFGHTLSYSYVMDMALFLAAGVLIAGKNFSKRFLIVVIVFTGLAMVAAFSRGTWYAAILTALALLFVVPERSIRMIIVAILAVVILCGLLIPQFHERAAVASTNDNGKSDREVYWEIAVKMWEDHPIMGIGADNWDLYYPRYKPADSSSPLTNPDHPHNEYLNILSSFGIFGLTAYLWMWAAFLLAALRALKKERDPLYRGILIGGTAAIFSVLIAQVTQDIFHDFTDQLLWWFIAGLVLVAIERGKMKSE